MNGARILVVSIGNVPLIFEEWILKGIGIFPPRKQAINSVGTQTCKLE